MLLRNIGTYLIKRQIERYIVMVKMPHFLFKISWSRNIKRLSLIFKKNSELLETRTLKSSEETY